MNEATSTKPLCARYAAGVRPSLLNAHGSAPCRSKFPATARLRHTCNGVNPFWSPWFRLA
jgi:hypothetical protein